MKCNCKIPKPFDIRKIPMDCKSAYDLISIPLNKGIFQVDSKLGREWGSRLKPKKLEDISDLISIVRPGCLATGISERYLQYRDSGEEPEYLHETLKPILASTNGQMIYQEQMMKICWKFAGLDLETADNIRKACGHKIRKLMAKQKNKFSKGCKKTKRPEYAATKVWEEIEKSADYSFAKAHAICYSITAYRTAFLKAHFTIDFFTELLKCSKWDGDQQSEIAEIISDCWRFGISVLPPRLSDLSAEFQIIDDKTIHFGSQYVKRIGAKKAKKFQEFKKKNSLAKSFSSLLDLCSKDAFQAFIKIGMFDEYTKNRDMLLFAANSLAELKSDEVKALVKAADKGMRIKEAIDEVRKHVVKKGARSKRRLTKIDEVIKNVNDSFSIQTPKGKIASYEIEMLGAALSDTSKEFYKAKEGSHKCSDLMLEQDGVEGEVFATVRDFRPYTTRRGKQMGFLDIVDDTGMQRDVAVFPKNYFDWKPMLYKGASRLFSFKVMNYGISIAGIK